MRTLLRLPFLLALFALLPAERADAACATRVLASGYFSNNVHVYDGCTGEFQRLLDGNNRIVGPQAVKIGPNGMLYVVSEENGRILRYHATTLDFIDVFVTPGAAFGATGIAFGPDGDVYVCGYDEDSVRRYDGQTGQLKATVVAPRAAGLNGPDNGMTFGPDGRLYIPGYDSNSVVVYNPATGQTSGFIANGSGGLFHTRGILFESNGNVLVSSEGNGNILRYSPAGAFIGIFASGLGNPTGMSFTPSGEIVLGASDTNISRVSATGQFLGVLNAGGSGGLNGSTYAAVIPAPSSVDTAQVGTQYWIVGAGRMNGRVLDIADVISSTGTRFGDAFQPTEVVRKRWGSVRIEFTGCRAAQFSWNASGDNSAGFGSGQYPVSPLVPTAFTTQCEAVPFAQVQGTDWINGSWWGGATRDGEGFFLTQAPDGTVFFAWFTYRPPT
jgi:WD40 repeat protein